MIDMITSPLRGRAALDLVTMGRSPPFVAPRSAIPRLLFGKTTSYGGRTSLSVPETIALVLPFGIDFVTFDWLKLAALTYLSL